MAEKARVERNMAKINEGKDDKLSERLLRFFMGSMATADVIFPSIPTPNLIPYIAGRIRSPIYVR